MVARQFLIQIILAFYRETLFAMNDTEHNGCMYNFSSLLYPLSLKYVLKGHQMP